MMDVHRPYVEGELPEELVPDRSESVVCRHERESELIGATTGVQVFTGEIEDGEHGEIKLVSVDPAVEVNESIVEHLELLLEDARAGGLIAFAAAYVRPSGAFGSVLTRTRHNGALGGAVALLQYRWCANGEDEDVVLGSEPPPAA